MFKSPVRLLLAALVLSMTSGLHGQFVVALSQNSVSISGGSANTIVGTGGLSRWGDTSGTTTATATLGYTYTSFGLNGAGDSGTADLSFFYTGSNVTGVSIDLNGPTGLNVLYGLSFTPGSVALSNWTFDPSVNEQFAQQANAAVSGYQGASLSVTAIPEPSTYAAILGGLALLGLGVHRRFRKSNPV